LLDNGVGTAQKPVVLGELSSICSVSPVAVVNTGGLAIYQITYMAPHTQVTTEEAAHDVYLAAQLGDMHIRGYGSM